MLKLVRRGKKGVYYIWGSLSGHRYRESTGTNSGAKLAQRQNEILDRLTWGEKRTALFAEAVILYLNKKGGGIHQQDARAIDKLTARFGTRRLADISEMDLARFAADVYPTAGPHGIDRFIYSPLIAVYRTAAKAGLCELPRFQRPARPKRKAVSFAKDDTLAALLRHCGERLAAALLFVSFTGARASECCRLEEADVDWERHEALLRHTKNGEPRVVVLPGLVYEALARLKGRHGPLFGFKQRHSLNRLRGPAAARGCPLCPRTRSGATPSQRGC